MVLYGEGEMEGRTDRKKAGKSLQKEDVKGRSPRVHTGSIKQAPNNWESPGTGRRITAMNTYAGADNCYKIMPN